MSGTCEIASCASGFGDCDGLAGNGCESPLDTLANCDGCGMSCDLPNAAESCPMGTCTLGACVSGFGDCDGTASNGCETTLRSLSNCGACGTTCNFANASESCSSGTCTFVSCHWDWADCDGTLSNGCEVDLDRDEDNCGTCGNRCSSGDECDNGDCD
jgi:hypothetical protein